MGFRTLYLFIFSIAIAAVNGNNEGDWLYSWKTTLSDPNNVLQSWDPTLTNPCTWFHITCNIDNSVVRVDLGNANISGTLSPALANLANLQYLEVYSNFLTGEVPQDIGKLTSLVSLDIHNNLLSGALPSTLGNLKSMRLLNLSNNNLTGQIPPEISDLKHLESLDLSNNQFSGSIPASFGNLKSLGVLRLNGNALSGDLPDEVLKLVNVRQGNLILLNVSDNFLAGRVPPTNSKGRLTITTIIQDARA